MPVNKWLSECRDNQLNSGRTGVWISGPLSRKDAAKERMGEGEKDKGPVDPYPAEPVRMDANRGLASTAGLRSEQVFTACPRFHTRADPTRQ